MTEDEERSQFYAAIGEGITEWTHVEDMLFLIVQNLLAPEDHTLLAAAFYAIDSFRGKMEMTGAVIRHGLAGNVAALEGWKTISKALKRKYDRRNVLAHHQVYFDPKQPEGRRYRLVSPILDPDSKRIGLEPVGIHLSELSYRIKIFKVLCRRIRGFAQTYAPMRP
jgi:hypothetical protein